MKKLLMCTAAVLLAAGLAVAQNTGGDKLVGGREKSKSQPKPEVSTQATHQKGHKGGKKTTATDDWMATGSGASATSSSKKTSADDWMTTDLAKNKKGQKGGSKNSKGPTPQFADGSVRFQKAPSAAPASGSGGGVTPALNPQPLPPGRLRTPAAKTKTPKSGRKSTDSTILNNGTGSQARPGVPPPTRPTDPK